MLSSLNSKYLILALLVVILLILLFVTYSFMNRTPSSNLPMQKLKIGSKTITVEIAESQADQIKGLSGREKLDANAGLYFKYTSAGTRAIWMKDMKFAIDVLWIREGEVREISPNIVPLGMGMPIVTAKEPADAFIELNTGFAAKHNLKVGNKVVFQ